MNYGQIEQKQFFPDSNSGLTIRISKNKTCHFVIVLSRYEVYRHRTL